MSNPFTATFENLPAALPIFPLSRAIVLPGQRLPLNIFEPRYLSMVLDALANGRHIGMIQPSSGACGKADGLYPVGCAGRITLFEETEDGRFVVQLTGVSRFDVGEEIDGQAGYRRIRPDWERFRADLEPTTSTERGFSDLESPLRAYATANAFELPWDTLADMDPVSLIDALSTQLPFVVEEKQALLEAMTPADRADVLIAALHMAAAGTADAPVLRH